MGGWLFEVSEVEGSGNGRWAACGVTPRFRIQGRAFVQRRVAQRKLFQRHANSCSLRDIRTEQEARRCDSRR